MVKHQSINMECDADELTYREACRIARCLGSPTFGQIVHLNLRRAVRASTAGFAKLIAVREHLAEAGGDLRVAGLEGQPEDVYRVFHIDHFLPSEPASA